MGAMRARSKRCLISPDSDEMQLGPVGTELPGHQIDIYENNANHCGVDCRPSLDRSNTIVRDSWNADGFE